MYYYFLFIRIKSLGQTRGVREREREGRRRRRRRGEKREMERGREGERITHFVRNGVTFIYEF